jgi:hypothetical protein
MPPGSAVASRRGDIDATAEDGAVLDHDIADIDPNAPRHSALGRQDGISLCQSLLHGYGAINRIDNACELGQYAIAGCAGDFSATRRN